MSQTAKFCHVCGRALLRRYPGCYLPNDPPEHIRAEAHLPPDERVYSPEANGPMGNPEAGPAGWRCPAGHDTIREDLESELADEIIEDFLDRLVDGQAEDPYSPKLTPEAQQGAKAIKAWQKSCEDWWEKFQREQITNDD